MLIQKFKFSWKMELPENRQAGCLATPAFTGPTKGSLWHQLYPAAAGQKQTLWRVKVKVL